MKSGAMATSPHNPKNVMEAKKNHVFQAKQIEVELNFSEYYTYMQFW